MKQNKVKESDLIKKDKITCIRCGVCCSTGPCSHGKEDSYGICIYLIIGNGQKGQTSCRLILENKVDPKDIGIGTGCILRRLNGVYDYYHLQMQERLEGIKGLDKELYDKFF